MICCVLMDMKLDINLNYYSKHFSLLVVIVTDNNT